MSSSLASPAHHNWKDLRAFGWALPTLCWLSPTPMWHTGSQTPSGGLCVSLPKARLGLANSTAPMGKRGSRDRGVTDPRHHAERSRHHTKDKQRFVVSVIAYDSLPWAPKLRFCAPDCDFVRRHCARPYRRLRHVAPCRRILLSHGHQLARQSAVSLGLASASYNLTLRSCF